MPSITRPTLVRADRTRGCGTNAATHAVGRSTPWPVQVAPAPGIGARPCQARGRSLTRVALAYVPGRLYLTLRFGEPLHVVRLGSSRRAAVFTAEAVFCRVCLRAGGGDTDRWQLLVMQACAVPVGAQRIPGVRPDVRLLLQADGERAVWTVLPLISAIEALGLHPAAVAPAYWRTLGERLAVSLPLPVYTAAQHAAWLATKAAS